MEKLKAIISNYTNKNIDANSNLLIDLGLYSMEIASLAHDVEQAFNIRIQFSDLKHVQTVKDLQNLITNKEGV
ncbi:acyl carrier protein [Lactiplantibacillus plantarum]|uniref:acyl carrier protein n=1 Tax=Lactiplantibacillus plantarum TaxID=1590 RepID=UPI001C1F6335|nr:acyl carrier protein [Lactiplantibacillus plantarum]MBU7471918.1 acyl carrier protein [Lactiplantibacillus plantarum]